MMAKSKHFRQIQKLLEKDTLSDNDIVQIRNLSLFLNEEEFENMGWVEERIEEIARPKSK